MNKGERSEYVAHYAKQALADLRSAWTMTYLALLYLLWRPWMARKKAHGKEMR
jgi:hypothetical protein